MALVEVDEVNAVGLAKIFMTGRSQAVRLPKAYRFDADEVLIERQPDGSVRRRKGRTKR